MNKAQLIEKAKTFGIDTEGLTVDQLKAAIKQATAEKTAALEEALNNAQQEFIDLPDTASAEDIQAAQDKVDAAEKELSDFTGIAIVKTSATDSGTFELNGSLYAFKKSAPERFNFVGKNKSQAEWLADKDAMELLISGRSSFVKSIKK